MLCLELASCAAIQRKAPLVAEKHSSPEMDPPVSLQPQLTEPASCVAHKYMTSTALPGHAQG